MGDWRIRASRALAGVLPSLSHSVRFAPYVCATRGSIIPRIACAAHLIPYCAPTSSSNVIQPSSEACKPPKLGPRRVKSDEVRMSSQLSPSSLFHLLVGVSHATTTQCVAECKDPGPPHRGQQAQRTDRHHLMEQKHSAKVRLHRAWDLSWCV